MIQVPEILRPDQLTAPGTQAPAPGDERSKTTANRHMPRAIATGFS